MKNPMDAKIKTPKILRSPFERNRIKEGLPIKYLVPKEVEEYIKKHNLYKEDDPWEERKLLQF